MSGKGSRQRPYDKQKFESNWDKIFGSKDKKEQPKESKPVKIKQ